MGLAENHQSEFNSVVEAASGAIDTLYAARKTNIRIADLPDGFLEGLRFEINMVSQVLERIVAERRASNG